MDRKINAFICESLHSTITRLSKDIEGKFAIPSHISCPVCKGPAQSLNYQVDQKLKPMFEWYKPSDAEVTAIGLQMSEEDFARLKKLTDEGLLLSRLIE